MPELMLPPEHLATVRELLATHAPEAEVWAYGSRVNGRAHAASDLDLALRHPADLTQRQAGLDELKSAFSESNLPFLVDVMDWARIPESFRQEISRQHVVVREAIAVSPAPTFAAAVANLPIRYPLVSVGCVSDSVSETHQKEKDNLIFLNTSDILEGKILHRSYSVVKDWPGQAKKSIKRDDILLSEIRPANGRWAHVNEDASDFVVSTKLMVIRARRDQVVPKLLYQFLTSSATTNWLQHLAESRSGTFPQITFDQVSTLEMPLPPIQVQRTIANIIDWFDDKIELNRSMNATLEATARAIFKSWFVDFDPVRAKAAGREPVGMTPEVAALFPYGFERSKDGTLPTAWRYAAIDEVCAINAWTLGKRDDLEMIEYIEISEVSHGNIATISIYSRGEEPSRARRRLRHGDTVLSTVRPDRGSYFLALNPSDNRVASTGFAVLTPTKAPWSFIHAAMTQPEVFEYLGQMADGGAYPAVRPEIIGAMKVAVPNDPMILQAFHGTCAQMFEQAEVIRAQSRTLAALRDVLLPKLLSGELRVAEAAGRVAEALS